MPEGMVVSRERLKVVFIRLLLTLLAASTVFALLTYWLDV
jgi:hypothetical protein